MQKKELTPPGEPTQSAPGTGDEKERRKFHFNLNTQVASCIMHFWILQKQMYWQK